MAWLWFGEVLFRFPRYVGLFNFSPQKKHGSFFVEANRPGRVLWLWEDVPLGGRAREEPVEPQDLEVFIKQ